MSGSDEVRHTKGGTDQGPWNKDKYLSSKNVRSPKIIPDEFQNNRGDPPQYSGGSEMKPPDPLSDVIRTSTLNVNAQEFVPQWSQPQMPQIPTPEDISYLLEAIDVLTLNPGRYIEFLPPIEDIVESLLQDKNGLAQVIGVILELCIMESNFRYTGARLCRDLGNKFGFEFLNCLLSRCGELYHQLFSSMDKDRGRATGFAMLLAELYLQITVDETTHIASLGHRLYEVLTKFLSIPAYDTIRTVCQIIKLCYAALKNLGVSLDQIFAKLEELSESLAVEENARRLIAGLLQMRRTEWEGHVAVAPGHAQSTRENYFEPVFYSPDGQIMSEEERSFLLENIPVSEDLDDYIVDNDMDDEVSAAFDEFVSYSQNNHPSYRP